MSKFYLLLIFFISCSGYDQLSSDEKTLLKKISEFELDSTNLSSVYIIYSTSCRECNQNMIRYIESKLKMNKNDYFIFTNVKSYKELKGIIPTIIDHPKVIIDKNKFYKLKYSKDFTFPVRIDYDDSPVINTIDNEYFRMNAIL